MMRCFALVRSALGKIEEIALRFKEKSVQKSQYHSGVGFFVFGAYILACDTTIFSTRLIEVYFFTQRPPG